MCDQKQVYPEGMENGKTKIPLGKALGKIDINKVKAFAPIKGAMLQCFRCKGGNPEIFIDIETPRPEYRYMEGTEIHLGIRGKFELENLFKSNVKQNRIDVYIPLDQAMTFVASIIEGRRIGMLAEEERLKSQEVDKRGGE